ncbi:S53 family peptidase [Solimicrobium silvestre]|uniref:Pro-kumamolisin, activation domain n=1 Tax=Solimicrobium silvestre TaxID=2099400 RepID=A0A2S9H1J3_9BURK|nr:S53 family peptidase [Solimicrobium silvestre]PRC93736.1 Pro-kumamolisin, activation domain [Solimicrobium silvestre]
MKFSSNFNLQSNASAGEFVLPRISSLALAISLACGVMGAQAAVDTSSWVPTKTEAFLAKVHTHDSTGAEVTADQIAVEMAQGEQKSVTVSLQLRNQAQLESFLTALHTPGNASYHKFLTPAQFAAQYSPTQAQVDAVVAHLTSAGFKNISVSSNRTLVSADGTAATVKQAFNTSLKRFTHEGRSVYANDKPAQIPAALADIVGSVLGLQNAAIHHATHSGVHTAAKSGTQAATGTEVAHIPTQYPGIYNAVTTPAASTAIVGTIAEGNMTYTLQDFATFLSNNPSLPKLTPTVVYVGGENTTDESGEVEWALDSQVIYGAAGGVKQLIFYTANSMEDAALTAAYNAAVTANVASVVNVSLGECEASAKSSGSQAADDAVFKQAVAQGITFSVAAGDAGPYNCDTDSQGNPGVAKTTTQKKTYDVSEPASSPYVVAVGGTALFTTSTGAYAGQAVWNEGSASTGDGSAVRIWSTGGGFSKNELAPAWQTASIVGSGHTYRGLPDIVFDAAQASGTNIYINQAANGTAYAAVGGTSMAAPMFAGFWARLESAHGNNLGFPNSAFYKAIPANPGLVFPVTSATVDGDSIEYNGWSTTYPGMSAAASGWSAATGFGSLNIDAVNAYITANPTVFPPK